MSASELQISLDRFGVSTRTENILIKQQKFTTINDVARLTVVQLLSLKGCGATTVREIKAWLASLGLELAAKPAVESAREDGTDSSPEFAALERLRRRFEALRCLTYNEDPAVTAAVVDAYKTARGLVEEEIALLHGFGPFEPPQKALCFSDVSTSKKS